MLQLLILLVPPFSILLEEVGVLTGWTRSLRLRRNSFVERYVLGRISCSWCSCRCSIDLSLLLIALDSLYVVLKRFRPRDVPDGVLVPSLLRFPVETSSRKRNHDENTVWIACRTMGWVNFYRQLWEYGIIHHNCFEAETMTSAWSTGTKCLCWAPVSEDL